MHISNYDATRLDDNCFLLLFDKREVCQNAALMTKFSKHIIWWRNIKLRREKEKMISPESS